jgi:hypothetical protein
LATLGVCFLEWNLGESSSFYTLAAGNPDAVGMIPVSGLWYLDILSLALKGEGQAQEVHLQEAQEAASFN